MVNECVEEVKLLESEQDLSLGDAAGLGVCMLHAR